MIVRVKNDTITYKHYDYKPFGDTLNADKEERWGYLADEKDKENNYIMMNFRTYDPKIGRFLSVDPLFESMPGQSPYNYSFNNPMGYTDPSGLKPEKAKGDKIQSLLKDLIGILSVMNETAIDRADESFGDKWDATFGFGFKLLWKSSGAKNSLGQRVGVRFVGNPMEQRELCDALMERTNTIIEYDQDGWITAVYGRNVEYKSCFREAQTRLVNILTQAEKMEIEIDIMFEDHDKLNQEKGTAFYHSGPHSFGYLINPTVLIDRQEFCLKKGDAGFIDPLTTEDRYCYLAYIAFPGGSIGRNHYEENAAENLGRVETHEFLGHVWQFVNFFEGDNFYKEIDAIFIENLVGNNFNEPYRISNNTHMCDDYYRSPDLKGYLPEYMFEPWRP